MLSSRFGIPIDTINWFVFDEYVDGRCGSKRRTENIICSVGLLAARQYHVRWWNERCARRNRSAPDRASKFASCDGCQYKTNQKYPCGRMFVCLSRWPKRQRQKAMHLQQNEEEKKTATKEFRRSNKITRKFMLALTLVIVTLKMVSDFRHQNLTTTTTKISKYMRKKKYKIYRLKTDYKTSVDVVVRQKLFNMRLFYCWAFAGSRSRTFLLDVTLGQNQMAWTCARQIVLFGRFVLYVSWVAVMGADWVYLSRSRFAGTNRCDVVRNSSSI